MLLKPWSYFGLCRNVLVSVLLGLVACEPVPGTVILQDDFEQAGAAVPRPPEISSESAHSGSFSYKVALASAYGPSWQATWDAAGQPKKLRVKAWLNLPGNRQKTAVVVEVSRNGATRYWRTLSVNEVVKRFHQWELVWKTFVLPRDMGPDDTIKVYLWQAGERQILYVDDWTIEKVAP
ncbi:hypothetical protein FY528_11790 [Hymenobacter lutimineralis]|uniref:CBM-cenC domain-containing protein n=1 Tax=Hymenobacter lutimineralis TaxID=2606448 RepID=A0A5D6V0E6_9BACT|nr:hypothetical protein [Hymenobacter lutimineralis]TYZ08890.1 hypothetical protein FY528_11790 [Hymenobacter lutimineralis]